MGRRYYCDFCNRGFADTPFSRRKHISSNQHLRLRKLHYDSFKDAATLLAEDTQKQPCKRFFQYGHCDFGNHCRYSHIDHNKLKAEQALVTGAQQQQTGKEPRVEEWLKRWKGKHKNQSQNSESIQEEPDVTILPPFFPPLHQLPPSLLPPPPGGFPKAPRLDWG